MAPRFYTSRYPCIYDTVRNVTGPINGFNRPLGSRVLVRVVRYPLDVRGEVLAVYIDSRTMTDPDEVVYSFCAR